MIGRKSESGELNLWVKKNKTGRKDIALSLRMSPLNGSFVTASATPGTDDLTEGFDDFGSGDNFVAHWEDR